MQNDANTSKIRDTPPFGCPERPDGSVFAIEVKKSESVTNDDFKGIRALAELAQKEFTGGVVLYTGKDVVPFGKNLWAVPVYIIWQ